MCPPRLGAIRAIYRQHRGHMAATERKKVAANTQQKKYKKEPRENAVQNAY